MIINRLIALMLLVLTCGSFCKNPTTSENLTYRDNVRITYTRDTNSITNQLGDDSQVAVFYQLYDPALEDKVNLGYMSILKKSNNTYEGVLTHVLVHKEYMTAKHKIHISDPKTQSNTGKGVVVANSYAEEIVPVSNRTELHFKIK